MDDKKAIEPMTDYDLRRTMEFMRDRYWALVLEARKRGMLSEWETGLECLEEAAH